MFHRYRSEWVEAPAGESSWGARVVWNEVFYEPRALTSDWDVANTVVPDEKVIAG